MTILSMAGMQLHIPVAEMIAFIFFCSSCMVIYANIQQSRKLANAETELSKVDGKIKQATDSVYTQKREEITKLELDVALWKDRASNQQEELLVERDRIDKLQQSLNAMTKVYKRAVGISEGCSDVDMTMKVIKEGSPEHLNGMSNEGLYQRAQQLARKAGTEI